MERNYFKYFIILVVAVAIVRLWLLNAFNLVPQEAYYWLYIQRPALSYFDHPPICSYTIGLGTLLFGNNEFGVRIGMLLLSIGTSFFIFLLARKYFNDDKGAFLTVVFLNLTTFFNLHSIVATPDAPLLFFWAGTMFFYYRALFEGDKWVDWIIAGIFSGLALSSKYTGAFIFISLILFLIIDKQLNKLFSAKFFLSLLFASIMFLPVIIWNIQNGFASFLFQTSGRAKGVRGIGINYFLQLVASQLYELTPIFFLLLFIIMFRNLKKLKKLSTKELFLSSFSFPITLFFFLVSFTSLVKMNWILPGYLSFIILSVSFYLCQKEKVKRLVKYLGLSFSLAFIIFHLIIIITPVVPIEKGDSWTGWREIANRIITLKQEYDKENKTFIFSNEYKIPAELAFYTPFKDVILAENVYGKPALQFDFWFDVREFSNWDAIFVYSDYNPSVNLNEIEKYFSQVQFVEEFKIIKRNKVFRKFFIYRCKKYNTFPLPTNN
ncbi:MAG: glycosyltransferase family 39 protein [Ignavibacteria bacterium]|nr:glycosyltransferase family 39 protein [Ignavibacteria bacterium]